ncbi:MAG: H-NS histone family protein [Albidovulum sp.]|nr:H-NS histone family protein [Albidovulum sp.]MDE0304257.1 H-NS histone family protein [Albidovulum sp.]MDE0531545.1 H-NS histone family protein [Albidovulum sp.]
MQQNIDLESLSLEELKSLQKDVTKHIENYEVRKRNEAARKTAEFAAQFGFSLDELAGVTKTRARRSLPPVKPKYRNPDDASVTWSGRGRKPIWLEAKLAEGAMVEDFLIENE